MLAFVGELVAMFALFIVMLIFLGPMGTDPLYLPIYPAIIVPLGFGAALLGTGAYFKKSLYDLSDFSEKPAVRARYGKYGLVYVVAFLVLALVFLVALPPFGDTNLAEQSMVREDQSNVGSNTYIRLQFQGADVLGSYRAELSVTSRNNVTLNFYLMDKSDAEAFDPAIPPSNVIVPARENVTSYAYKGTELKAQDYTLIISNLNNDTAVIHYKVFQRTSDGLSLFFILFFLVYVGIAGGWVAYLRTLARTETVPVITPPVPVPVPPRPAMPGPPQPGMGMPAHATAPTSPGPAPESGGVPMSITCPRCGTGFEVMRGAGPTKIKCPGCGKEGTLAGLPAAAIAAARAQQAPAQPAPAQQPAMAQEPMPQRAPAQQYASQQYAPQRYAPEQYAPQYPEAPARPEYPPARMEQAGTGTSYPPSAPQGYGQTGPAAGDMYAQPAPPPAPSVPQSPYDQLMAMGLGPTEPAIPEAPATPVAAPALSHPAPAPVAKKTIACPRCKQAFQIDKVEGPQHIRCPHCGKEGTVGAKKPAGPAPATPPAPAPAPRPAPAPAPRPAIQTPPPMGAAAPAGAPAGPKMISCPACKKPFAVTETRRPIQVKCPACGKEGVLRK
jgi:DNA-directed RNA polymerase subunit RPC12/RpoP